MQIKDCVTASNQPRNINLGSRGASLSRSNYTNSRPVKQNSNS